MRPGQPHVLVLDRTHWTLGRTDLNVLCVGLVYQGVSIPLAYQSLEAFLKLLFCLDLT